MTILYAFYGFLRPLQDKDRVWIVTELCSGGDLEHFMKVLIRRLDNFSAPIVT